MLQLFWVVIMAFVIIAVIIIIIYILITYIMFLMVCKNNKNKMPMEKEVAKTLEPYKDMIDIGQKWMEDKLKRKQINDIYIKSNDGLKLHAIFIMHPHSKGIFLECHGYKSTAQRDLYPSCHEYYKMGYSLLIPDNRACGLSEGKYVTFGMKESDDVICWVKYINKSYHKQAIILAGVSMGATSILLALKHIKRKMNIKCALVDCGFVSAYDEVLYCIKHYFHLHGKLFIGMINFWCKRIAKFSLKKTNTTLLPNKVKIPILFIHGVDDDFVPCENTKVNYEKYDGPKEIVLFEKTSHGISYLVDSKRYLDAIQRTIDNS